MSKHPHDPIALQAWAGETAAVPARPSWMSRRMSTRPPITVSVPPLPPMPLPSLSAEDLAVPPPPPPAVPALDLTTTNALAQLTEENAALRGQVAEMAAAMARLRRQILEASEGELVNLVLVIAERVVGRELATDPALVVAWARDAIDTLAAKDEVVIAVAKDVPPRMTPHAWDAVGVEHRVQVDGQLAAGSIEVRTPEGIVATTAEARLGAVAQALGVDPS